MTTTSVHPVVSPQRFRRRLVHAWRTLFAPGDLTAMLIVLAMLVMPALALNRAGWPLALPVVLPVIVLSVFFGLLLAHSQYNELLALVISALYGCCFVLLFAALSEPGGLQQGVYSVFTRTVNWIVDAVSGGINQDDLVFTLLVAILFWFLGYNAAWHIFRIDRVWRVVLPPGLILAANAIFYDGDADLEFYMVGYFFMVLLLIVRSNLDERAWSWYVSGIRTPRAMHQQFLRIGAVLALVSLIFAWGLPSGNLQDRLDRFQNFLQSDPLTQLGEFWNRLFTSVEAEGPVTADYYGGDSLELGGAIRLGEQEVFFVSAPPTHRYYWRSRVFDTYDRGRWTPAADKRLTTPDSPLDIQYNPDDLGARELVEQEFTLGLNTSRLIYTAPQPLQVGLPTRTDLRYVEDDTWNVSVIRPLKVIRRGDTYTAQSLISNATATQLRAVPPVYPEWVQVLYVNAPLTITERTVQLTNQIVAQAGAVTVYDKTKAVEVWLRNNIVYNEIIPQPPLNQDPIDWVLFDLKEGYCEYYASAMIIMLRSLGIPARMAAGFSQGTWDAASQRYMIQERDAHTWVEVYFPGYGWIEFEPTAAQAPLNRIGDNEFLPPPTPLPAASPTPSPTVTPTVLPTTTVTPNQQQDSVIPTITPTFTPSPTATPIIVPTQPPPIRPPQRGLLSFLLPTLGLALLGLLLIILLVGIMVFIWWWWEWRGMKGLSPVTRAYARLERFAALVGIRFKPQQTPEERRQNLLRDLPQSKRPVTAITRMYTVERYGPRQNPMEEPKTTQIAGRAWSEARSSILKRFLKRFVPWRRR
jgi:transglutaminase-like putative cysteine protease